MMHLLDRRYLQRLNRVANFGDDAFPEILMQPRFNSFDDVRYHTMDLTDASNSAVTVDPRFTSANITAIRATAKSMSKYLNDIALWDDYMKYLEMKYGSVEIAAELEEMGLLTDPWPGTDKRPRMRNPVLRKALEAGSVPSFYPAYYSTPEVRMSWIEWVRHVNDLSMPNVAGLPEPDPEYRKELTEDDIAYNRKMGERLRRAERLNMLKTTAYASNAVASTRCQPGIDFIERFYADVESGAFEDPQFTDYRNGGIVETEMRLRMQEELMTETQKLMRERAAEKRTGGLEIRDGVLIRKSADTEDEMAFLVHLQKEFGIDVFAAMQNAGMSKKGIKAIRTKMQDAGYEVGLSKKQLKKAKKMEKKNKQAMQHIASGSESLSSLLNTNKLFMNRGSIRFEEGWNLSDFDDD